MVIENISKEQLIEKLKKAIPSIIYLLVIIGLIYIIGKYTQLIRKEMAITFEINKLNLLVTELLYVFIGFSVGSTKLIQLIKMKQKIKLNIYRFVIVFLPLLYVSLFVFFIYALGMGRNIFLSVYIFRFLVASEQIRLVQVVCGFILASCFDKKEQEEII